jgi:galactose mutarotase-like enzyme
MTQIFESVWYGFKALNLENEMMRVEMVPELGAKIVSVFDKRAGFEWLVPPVRQPQRCVYGTEFTSQDMSGWDEMFPTISACPYPGSGDKHGAAMPDHGEVWSMPWMVEQAGDGRVTLRVDGPVLPYRLRRTAQLGPGAVLELTYLLENFGEDRLPYLWAAHPQFVADPEMAIVFPEQICDVWNVLPENWGWGAPETSFSWPEALALNGRRVRLDQVGPPELRQARKFFALPGVKADWAALVRRNTKNWLRLEWEAALIPYLGLWVDEGAINTQPVAAPEPMTGFYDSLELACSKNKVAWLAPGAKQEWLLTLRLGTGKM